MRATRLLASLLLIALATAGPRPAAAQEEDVRIIGDRGTTARPNDARFEILTGGYKTTPGLLRLDRVTGRTWTLDERQDRWAPIPVEGLAHPAPQGPARFQLVVHDRTWLLLDADTGQTWRYGREARRPGEPWGDLATPVGEPVDGWHRIGD
ncbi:MAG TPA: hypothetical protein PLL30_05800 [Candidatus Krumholzibacteria bacterium]|nr:hypothetical protein [Candidatus Krumholzibacteria bacterium]HPD71277.1 hypothetical protein [Candidatus Krumholzibacteria bacterium]HRY39023.1 hypothetical protein [Candidatus Krumholzibacteria bacterium]